LPNIDNHTGTGDATKIHLSGVARSGPGTEKLHGKNQHSKGMDLGSAEEEISCFQIYYTSEHPVEIHININDLSDKRDGTSYFLQNRAVKLRGNRSMKARQQR
jgi:hypothetical protein